MVQPLPDRSEARQAAAEAPHTEAAEELLRRLKVEPARGLSSAEAGRRRARYGVNLLRRVRVVSLWRLLLEQLRSVMALLLVAASAVAYAIGNQVEAAAILIVVLINTALGFAAELRAVRAMESLRQIGQMRSRVRRGGRTLEIAAESLVPGDIILLEAGDVVTADLRLLKGAGIACDESVLTGESAPVSKAPGSLPAETPLAERSNLLFKGSAVVRGSGEAVAVATGMESALGQISALVEQAEPELSPLERRLARLSARLVGLTLLLAAATVVAGLLRGRALVPMVETGIALAIAAVPEGLPIVATVALARGMWRMARRNALVERLSAIETLGATTLILTDKTGTLTENRMTVRELVLASGRFLSAGEEAPLAPRAPEGAGAVEAGGDAEAELRRALEVAALCNGASLAEGSEEASGDPMEVALLSAARAAGVSREALVQRMPEVEREAFRDDLKAMSTLHRLPSGGLRAAVKGAPEGLIARASRVAVGAGSRPLTEAERSAWAERNEALAAEGLRVLALAEREVEERGEDLFSGLTLLGLVGLLDPPRPDVPAALAACRNAGVRVVMVTGDQAPTARHVARAVGFSEPVTVLPGAEIGRRAEAELRAADVLARVDPKQKLDLVRLYQRSGAVVAMTGDGVNDAPALKQADIGIAMGRRGSPVAREAADMVLADDAFPSIVAAVEEGRVIFDNLRKSILYLLSCNLSEILVVGIATVAGLPLPILPLQILFLNLVTDVFPAFALGLGSGGPGMMRRPPRNPQEPILGRGQWLAIAGHGLSITLATLGALVLALGPLGLNEEEAVTLSFLVLALAQLLHVFNMRTSESTSLRNEVAANPFIWAALLVCGLLLVAALAWPWLAALLRVAPLPGLAWLALLLLAALPLLLGQLALWRAAAPGRKEKS